MSGAAPLAKPALATPTFPNERKAWTAEGVPRMGQDCSIGDSQKTYKIGDSISISGIKYKVVNANVIVETAGKAAFIPNVRPQAWIYLTTTRGQPYFIGQLAVDWLLEYAETSTAPAPTSVDSSVESIRAVAASSGAYFTAKPFLLKSGPPALDPQSEDWYLPCDTVLQINIDSEKSSKPIVRQLHQSLQQVKVDVELDTPKPSHR